MHDLNLIHGIFQEFSLIVDCVSVVLVRIDLSGDDDRHIRVPLQKLWLELQSLLDKLLD